MGLKDRVVVVIGGGRGIGRSIALEAARHGAKIAVSARTTTEIEATVKEITKSGGQALGLTCDVRSTLDLQKLYQEVEAAWGPVYGVIYCAGVYGPIGPFEENDLQAWIDCIEINLTGAARALHPILPAMKQRREGRIILMSGAGQGPLPNFTAYSTSKGGIWRFTESLGRELAEFGVYLNSIAPGGVNTKFLDELLDAGESKAGKDMYQRAVKQKEEGGIPPEKAAALTLYLLSKESQGLWGRTLSAVWDDYENFSDLEKMCKTDLYQYRRVTHSDGKTR